MSHIFSCTVLEMSFLASWMAGEKSPPFSPGNETIYSVEQSPEKTLVPAAATSASSIPPVVSTSKPNESHSQFYYEESSDEDKPVDVVFRSTLCDHLKQHIMDLFFHLVGQIVNSNTRTVGLRETDAVEQLKVMLSPLKQKL